MGASKRVDLGAALVDGDKFRAGGKIDVPATGIVDLRHQAEIGHAGAVAVAEAPG